MTDPDRAGGGGQEAASALAARLVREASDDEGFVGRLAEALGADYATVTKKLGLSSEEAARMREHLGPAARALRQVCLAYHVNGHWLLTGQGDPRVDPSEVSERVREMIELVQRPSAPAAEPAAPPPRERSTNDAGYEWL